MGATRYLNENLPIVIQFDSDPLVIYGKSYADITEISMNFKKSLAKDADNKYLERTQTDSGVTLNQTNHTFTLKMDDYKNLIIGTFHLVIALQVTGFTEMIELEIKDDVVIITPDKQRA